MEWWYPRSRSWAIRPRTGGPPAIVSFERTHVFLSRRDALSAQSHHEEFSNYHHHSSEFTFLVMERMATPLLEDVPMFLKSHDKAKRMKKNPISDVFVTVLDCIHTMHKNGNSLLTNLIS